MSKLFRILVLAAVAAGLTTALTASSASGTDSRSKDSDHEQLEAILHEVHAIHGTLANPNYGLAEIKKEIRVLVARSNRLDVQSEVNEAACATGAVQCGDGGTGHTFAAASSANHNPVSITLLVTLNGAPLAGLPAAAFDFSDGIVPAGGPGLSRCPAGGTGCASPGNLFQDAGNGMYVIWVHPTPAGNWKAGSYYSRITVTEGAARASTLVEITVP
jgi:hypothetical protein